MTNGIQQEEAAPYQGIALFDMKEIVVGKKLGSGGFCNVYEARSFHPCPDTDLELNEPQREARTALASKAKTKRNKEARYAVKFLQPELTSNAKRFRIAARDLEMEAQVLSQVNHPNIIKIRGCAIATGSPQENTEHDRYFIIMDRLDETLCDRLDKWKIQAKRLNNPVLAGILDSRGLRRKHLLVERLQIATEIASALEYLHEKRIIYRDLKPGNLGFDSKTGRVQLFDFGLARSLPEESSEFNDTYKMSGRVGTYRFMAPEVATSSPYNEKTDVYSFSHILYQMLALEKPYQGYSKHTHRMKVARGGERPPIDSHWPRAIQEILKRAWSIKISERPCMTEIIAVLKEVISDLTGEPVVCDITTVCTSESLEQLTAKSISSVSFVPAVMPKVISFSNLKAVPAS